MKKMMTGVMLCFFWAAPGFADTVPFDQLYTVGAEYDVDLKDTFALNESPWAYLYTPSAPEGTKHVNVHTRWFHEGSEVFFVGLGWDAGQGDTAETWHGPGYFGAPNWADIAAPGNWRVDALYQFTDLPDESVIFRSGEGSFNFTVTPEPASMLLFGLGAAGLGLAGIRRKQN